MPPEAARIPIIDISSSAGTDNQAQVARSLVEAAVEYGFVYVRNTGRGGGDLSAGQIERAFEISRKLFRSAPEEKESCKIQNNRGWSGMHTETLDPESQRVGDFKEAFNFGTFENGKATHPIPPSIEPYQPELAAFQTACHNLCRKLLLLFGIGLEVTPPSFFTDAHPAQDSASILRLLYYPPTSATPGAQPGDVRAGAHSDYGSITLLFRVPGQAGLEILTPASGTWAPVSVTPPATESDPAPPVLVNIGDLLSFWTNGLLRSTVHRVAFAGGAEPGTEVDKGGPRYSIAYFCHPADATPLSPVPSQRVRRAGVSGDGTVLTAAEHLQTRLRATYRHLSEKGGEEPVLGSAAG